jgi:hypothetical protein
MTEAAALLDSRKKRKVEERASPPASKRSATVSSSERRHGESSSMSRSSHRSVREEGGHRERGKERRGRSRSRSHSRERDGRSGKSVRYVRKEDKTKKKRSPSPSFEEDFGVSKETLLHGSYADYIKEYSARSGRAGGGSGQSSSHQPHQTPAMLANLAAAYQKALNQFTTKLAQQDPSKVSHRAPSTKLHPPLSLFSSSHLSDASNGPKDLLSTGGRVPFQDPGN